MIVRPLSHADLEPLERFLASRSTEAMFLRSNLRQAGLTWDGRPYQGRWLGGFDGAELVGVAALFWNDNLVLCLPDDPAPLLRAVAALGAPVGGLSGPWRDVTAAREVLGLTSAPTTFASAEDLFALSLAELRVPTALTDGTVRCRPAATADLGTLATWRVAYGVETLGEEDSPAAAANAEQGTARAIADERLWVLQHEGALVAMSGFNAALPDVVQVGGVYTPPALRSRGFGRCAVAGSLLDARADGVTTALLFTANPAAARAYEALGFARIGQCGLVKLRAPTMPRVPQV